MSEDPSTRWEFLFIGAWMGAAFGFVFGFVAYIAAASVIESYFVPVLVSPDTPFLSYGQQFGFVMLPLASLYGAAIGSSLVIYALGGSSWGASVLLAATFFFGGIVALLWQSQVNQYGRDVHSELVLYAPFLPACALAVIFVATYALWSRLR